MLTLSAPRPLAQTGFAPAGPPRREAVDRIAVVGQAFRGAIRQLALFDGALLALVGRGLSVIDPDRVEVTRVAAPTLAFDALVVAGDRLLVRIGTALHPFDPATEALGAALATLPVDCGSIAGGAGVVAWPHPDGATLLRLADGTQQVLSADPALLGEGTWRKTPDRVAISPNGAWVAAWKDGGARTLWRAADGEIVHQHGWSTDGLVLLDDGRIAASDGETHQLITPGDAGEPPTLRASGVLLAAGDGLAIVDRFGGHHRVGLDPFVITRHVEGAAEHYGSMSQEGLAVASSALIAVYAESYGALFVTDRSTRRSDDWLSRPEGVSIAATGQRLVIESQWRDEGIVVDLAAGTVCIAEGEEGMSGPGISADGETLIVPVGDCLGPRTVCTLALSGGAVPTVAFKIRPWCCGIVSLPPDLVVIGTYSLRSAGWVAVHREGSARALMKLRHGQERPFGFVVNADATRCVVDWRAASTLHDLTARGRVIRELGNRMAFALGRGDRVAWVEAKGDDRVLVIEDGAQVIRCDLGPKRHPWGGIEITFSADDDLIFVGRADGDIEVRATADGALLRTLPLHMGALKALVTRAGLVWSLGEDGRLFALGIPGEAPVIDAPAAAPLPEEVPTPLPILRPWALDLPVLWFNVGSRVVHAALVDGEVALTDDAGAAVGALRKRKGDHDLYLRAARAHLDVLRGFAKRPAAAWRQLLDNAFLDGRSATAGELAGDPTGALEGTLWVTIEGRKRVLRYTDGALAGAEPGWRVRLAHPTKVSARSLSRSINRDRPTHAETNPQYTTAVPVETDWAGTQNPTVGRLLELRGFIRHLDSERATCAWHLPAPELGAVAVVGLDEEHGCSELTFYAWDGTLDGGEQLALCAVDPQLYAEAWQAVVDAYPDD